MARMKARRLQLAVARAGALPMLVGGERTLDVVEEELTGVNLALWEEIQAYARLRLALASAQRGRRELRARVAELLAERHSTNEALSDAAEALRAESERLPYAERAARESSPARRAAWRMLAQVEESERVADMLLAPEAVRSADRLTALLAPTQAPRDPRSCQACGDLPEAWCPDCAACKAGCFGGFDGNSCSHANTSWGGVS